MSNEVMPVDARAGRLAELTAELEEWERLAVLLADKAIASGVADACHDPQVAPAILLGVSVVDDANATRERLAS
jgi:hypothetical protein